MNAGIRRVSTIKNGNHKPSPASIKRSLANRDEEFQAQAQLLTLTLAPRGERRNS